jgi:hypothetical protein
MSKTFFTRKATDISELKCRIVPDHEKSQFVIEKVMELDKDEFDKFSVDLLSDYDFIKENIDLMYVDSDGVWHCILVKLKDGCESILIESEGYDYARYSSYLNTEFDGDALTRRRIMDYKKVVEKQIEKLENLQTGDAPDVCELCDIAETISNLCEVANGLPNMPHGDPERKDTEETRKSRVPFSAMKRKADLLDKIIDNCTKEELDEISKKAESLKETQPFNFDGIYVISSKQQAEAVVKELAEKLQRRGLGTALK